MPEHKPLTFPPKSEWPKFSAAEWASDRRHAFLKFKRLLLSMFTGLDFVIGNENYGGDWALLSDPAARKAHRTYPPPTSAPRRRVHRLTQFFLHRILLDIFSDHCPAIIADYLETSKFETLIKNFPGIPSASDFEHLEKWANDTAEQWNRLSPYDENLLNARPRFLQMLARELKTRKMAQIDKID